MKAIVIKASERRSLSITAGASRLVIVCSNPRQRIVLGPDAEVVVSVSEPKKVRGKAKAIDAPPQDKAVKAAGRTK